MTIDLLQVAPEVGVLRPDFVVLALLVSDVANGPTTPESDAWLREAEALASGASATSGPHPHVAAWHAAYRAFGAKPRRTASSVDALMQRAASGQLPRVNWLVDLYNAVSVAHVLPVGGEDANQFVGPLRLVRAVGTEAFDTVKDGAPATECPPPGEVVWADAAGVTCRRWNWRQGTRTRLTEGTTRVLFLLEALEPFTLDALTSAGDDLIGRVRRRYPGAAIDRRLLGPRVNGHGAR
jgi:DNA/RNA-binding domain of Phe-tRNA-synthetase-like protein